MNLSAHQNISMLIRDDQSITFSVTNKSSSPSQTNGRAFTFLTAILNQVNQVNQNSQIQISTTQDLNQIGIREIVNTVYTRYETRYRESWWRSLIDTFCCCFGGETELTKIENLRDEILLKLEHLKVKTSNSEESNSEESQSEESQSEEFICDNHELFNIDEYKNESEKTIRDDSFVSSGYSLLNLAGNDILPRILNHAGRAGCLSLMATCKDFYKLYKNNIQLKSYVNDYYQLRECFNLKSTIKYTEKNEIYFLLNEFNLHKVNFDKNEGLRDQLDYAIALAKIDPKNALKIVCPIIESNKSIEIQVLAFCVVAGIHKNSTFCKEEAVIKMGNQVVNNYQMARFLPELWNEKEGTRLSNLLNLFEAYLGLDNEIAIKILLQIDMSHHNNGLYLENNLKKILHTVERLHPYEKKIEEKILTLLSNLVDSVMILKYYNNKDLIIKISNVYALFDKNKATDILENALNNYRSGLENRNLKKDDLFAFEDLTIFANAFIKIDLNRAFLLAEEAYQIFENLTDNQSFFKEGINDPNDLNVLNRLYKILNIFVANDKAYALKIYEKIKNQLPSSDLNQILSLDIVNNFDNFNNFEEIRFLNRLFKAFSLKALINEQEALDNAKEYAAKMAENKKDNHYYINYLLMPYIAKCFPEKAIEIINELNFECLGANKLGVESKKFDVFMKIHSKKLSSKISESYKELLWRQRLIG